MMCTGRLCFPHRIRMLLTLLRLPGYWRLPGRLCYGPLVAGDANTVLLTARRKHVDEIIMLMTIKLLILLNSDLINFRIRNF